jgi:CubicO group peptidase (beta-lactamase class C family)
VFSRALAIFAAITLAGCAGVPTQVPPLRVAGLVTAKVDAAGKVTARAEGCALFASDGRTCSRALTTDSLMRVASISKLVVALGVMRLVEQGKLDLDRDASAYLGFALRNPAFADRQITLRQLLTHTSSLRDGNEYRLQLGTTLKDELANASHWDTVHGPGGYFAYSNFNSVVIATVMEAATGERFDRLMQRLVLGPLKIEGCYNWATCGPSAFSRAAVLYRTGPDETEWHPEGRWVAQVDDLHGRAPDCPVRRVSDEAPCDLTSYVSGTNGALFSPQGGLRISILDLAQIARFVATEGELDGARLLKPETIRAMLSPQWTYDPANPNGDTEKGSMCAYGLSIQLLNTVKHEDCRDDLFADGRLRAGHLAEAYGLYGGLWIDPATRRASIYLVTGTSDDPKREAPNHSGFTRLEERIAASLRE